MILNDDDYLLHDCIEVSLQILSQNPHAALLGGHSLHFGGSSLSNTPKMIEDICPSARIEIDLRLPSHVAHYRGYNDINMTHSGSSFYKSAWKAIGGYFPVFYVQLQVSAFFGFGPKIYSALPVYFYGIP